MIRKHVTAGHVGIGAKLALKGDAIGGSGHQVWSVEKCAPSRRKDLARALKIGGSIDTERNGVNDRHVDAHAILERPQAAQAIRASPASRA
jgi:hypothetical protein